MMLQHTERTKRISDRLAARGLHVYVRRIIRSHPVFEPELLGDLKSRSMVTARHALWKLLYDEAGLSFPEISEMFERTSDTIVRALAHHKQSRARSLLEQEIVDRVASYVGGVGYGELARELRAGAWRPPKEKCIVPSCPNPGLERLSGRCVAHPAASERAA